MKQFDQTNLNFIQRSLLNSILKSGSFRCVLFQNQNSILQSLKLRPPEIPFQEQLVTQQPSARRLWFLLEHFMELPQLAYQHRYLRFLLRSKQPVLQLFLQLFEFLQMKLQLPLPLVLQQLVRLLQPDFHLVKDHFLQQLLKQSQSPQPSTQSWFIQPLPSQHFVDCPLMQSTCLHSLAK